MIIIKITYIIVW